MGKSIRTLAAVAALLIAASGCRTAGDGETREAGEITTGPGVEGQVIKIGELSPLTGPVEVIGKPLTLGHEVYFKYVNTDLGGVGSELEEGEKFQVELVTRDTQYAPPKHVEQFNAIKGEVLAIGQSLGTPTTKAILPQLREDPILTGPATLSAEWLNEPFMFPAGAPYAAQFINAADYLVNEQKKKPKAGIIYQDDDYGQEGVNGLEFAAEHFEFDIVARATYKTGDQDFTAQVNEMRSKGADHVFLTAVPSAAGGILGRAATQNYTPLWIGQSPIWARGVFTNEQLLPYMAEHLWWVTDAGCEWGDTGEGCEGMKEMLDNLKKYAPAQTPDVYFLFGYTQARILHQILEKAIENGQLTRQGVIDAVADLRAVDMGGLLNAISYGTECKDRIPVTASNIFTSDASEPLAVKQLATIESGALDEFPFCPED